MKLVIRRDGTGSELHLFDVEPVVSIHDMTRAGNRQQPISGYLVGSMFRPLRFENQLYSLEEWEGIAYAAWLDRRLRRSMYGDIIPDVGESWTAKTGGVPITWPDWMTASWKADHDAALAIMNGHAEYR